MARGWWGSHHTTTLVVKCKRANKEGPDGLTPSSLLEPRGSQGREGIQTETPEVRGTLQS